MILEKTEAVAEQAVMEIQKPVIRKCPFLHGEGSVQLTDFTTGKQTKDTLHHSTAPIKCEAVCKGALMAGQSTAPEKPRSEDEVLVQAKEFFQQYFAAQKQSTPEDFQNRMNEITQEIKATGIYELTTDELQFGAKLAWRNAPRCIGRIQWNKLEVQDCRHITTSKEMFDALCQHMKYATNDGNIRSMITVFPPRVPNREDFRMWNPQLINFAGYLQVDGSVIGDPGRVQFTRICQRLGWKGKGGRFDILPWVVSAPGEGVTWYEVPEELVLRIRLEHPKYPWFADMDINWYAVPAVADMMLDLGGLAFTASPFNGWYMGTEIGARNLCDPQRYNLTKELAEKMELDTSTPVTLWKDIVLIEVNVAVLYSFRKNQVTIVDHHTASETFMKHMESEQKLRGGCPADWVWIVPPISGSITPVFHQEMICYNLKPSYEYQRKAWQTYNWPKTNNVELKYSLSAAAKAVLWCVALMGKVRTARIRATVLYATETGKSETFCRRLEKLLHASFNVQVTCMDDYNVEDLVNETLVIVVASTFGSGEPPDNGKAFWKSLRKMRDAKQVSLHNVKFSVFALGSSQYPMFCNFGKNVDSALHDLGAQRLMEVKLGDELRGQEHTFNAWLPDIYQNACSGCQITISSDAILPAIEAINTWNSKNFRLTHIKQDESDLKIELSKLHNRKLFPMKMLSRAKLQAVYSENQTLLIRLDTKDINSFNYKPGDHVGVFPVNPSEIVNPVLQKLKETGHNVDEVLQVETLRDGNWTKMSRLPPATLRTYFNRYLDITSPPSPHILHLMADLATDHWDRYRLKRLAQVTDDYEEWQSLNYPHLAELLEQFPSVQLDASLLLCELPLLQPRYYSISSSQSISESQVHLTVTLVTYKTKDKKGPLHRGVCTSYLNNMPDGDILCFIRNAPSFHLPDDTSLPIIMIGAGSGIAPFRSFWQHREFQIKEAKDKGQTAASFGPMVLFFGCRQAKVDNIYEQETAPLVRKGVLTRVFTALSREPGKPKCYVQDEMRNQAEMVRQYISQNGHVYVCGDAVIADGVKTTIREILGENPDITVDDLLDNGRYHEDVFGILHRR